MYRVIDLGMNVTNPSPKTRKVIPVASQRNNDPIKVSFYTSYEGQLVPRELVRKRTSGGKVKLYVNTAELRDLDAKRKKGKGRES